MSDVPHLLQTVIDAREPRELAEFYRELLGLHYREGDEPPTRSLDDVDSLATPEGPDAPRGSDIADDADWLVLTDEAGRRVLAIQGEPEAKATTWPKHEVPMQMHLDMTVPDLASLRRQRARAMALGATQILDRSDDADEPLFVLRDPAGHPFCVFVG